MIVYLYIDLACHVRDSTQSRVPWIQANDDLTCVWHGGHGRNVLCDASWLNFGHPAMNQLFLHHAFDILTYPLGVCWGQSSASLK